MLLAATEDWKFPFFTIFVEKIGFFLSRPQQEALRRHSLTQRLQTQLVRESRNSSQETYQNAGGISVVELTLQTAGTGRKKQFPSSPQRFTPRPRLKGGKRKMGKTLLLDHPLLAMVESELEKFQSSCKEHSTAAKNRFLYYQEG
jgi:hypothetical protein